MYLLHSTCRKHSEANARNNLKNHCRHYLSKGRLLLLVAPAVTATLRP